MKEFFERVKQKGSKRIVENAVIFLILLVILIIVINNINESNETQVVPTAITIENKQSDDLESRLEKILSKIEGAGKVSVMISYSASEEKVPLYDFSENTTITEERDKDGGTRKTESKNQEQNIIFEEVGNNKQPFVKQINKPKIIGVIVVAEGANNAKVKENLINAVGAVIDVPAHRIQVFR